MRRPRPALETMKGPQMSSNTIKATLFLPRGPDAAAFVSIAARGAEATVWIHRVHVRLLLALQAAMEKDAVVKQSLRDAHLVPAK